MISTDKIIPLLKEKKTIVISLVLLGLIIASAISFFLPTLYKSSARISFKYESVYSSLFKNSGSLNNETKRLYSDKNLFSAAKTLIKSENSSKYSLLNSAIEQIGNNNFESAAFQKQFIQNINEATEITIEEATTSIGIKVVSQNATESAEVANALVNAFAEYSIPNSKKTYLSALRNVEKRGKENIADIQRNNKNLQEYITNASLKSLNPKDEKLIEKIAELEAELESVELQNKYFISHLEYLQATVAKEFSELNSQISSLNDQKINDIKSLYERAKTEKQMTLATEKVSGLRITYPWTKKHNNIDTDSLDNLLKKTAFSLVDKDFAENNKLGLLKNLVWKIEETKSNINAIDFTKSIIYSLLTDLEENFNTIPIRYIELARLVRTKKINTKLDFKIKTKILKLKENEENYLAEIDSINKAIVPETFYSPATTLNLILGLLGGLLAGILFVLFSSSEALDNIEFPEDLEKVGYKVISQVPHFPNSSSSMLKLQSKGDISVNENKLVKSFQNIEAFLKYGNLEKEIKSVLVTSSGEKEGKTLVAANIATAIANDEERVLLVDVNFRTPNLDKFFNITSSPSLPHYLFKKKPLDDIIKTTNIKNLSLVTSIELTQNPAVIMKSERIKEFMEEVKSKFDYVVFDSSSLCVLKETIEIAKKVDEVIVVARANHTKLPQLKKAELILKESGITNFDVVLNDVEF